MSTTVPTGPVTEAYRPEEQGALPALIGSGLAGRNRGVALPAICDGNYGSGCQAGA